MEQTHWKKIINHDYLNEGDVDGRKIIATIKSINLEDVKSPTGKSEKIHVIRFAEQTVKPMILKAKQNFKNLQVATGTPYIEQWIGKKIEIYYDPTVKFGKETVGGIRISPKPIGKDKINPSSPRWAGMVAAIKSGSFSLERTLEMFEFTPEDLQTLKAEINA